LDGADTGGELVSDEEPEGIIGAATDVAFEPVARADAIEPLDVCDTTPAPDPEEVDGEPGGRETGVSVTVTVAPDLSVVTVVPLVVPGDEGGGEEVVPPEKEAGCGVTRK
jgi:hypothetical protein